MSRHDHDVQRFVKNELVCLNGFKELTLSQNLWKGVEHIIRVCLR